MPSETGAPFPRCGAGKEHQVRNWKFCRAAARTRAAYSAAGAAFPRFTLSIPTRYIHTVNEMAHVEDIQAAIDLLAAYLEEAHTRQYGYADEVL